MATIDARHYRWMLLPATPAFTLYFATPPGLIWPLSRMLALPRYWDGHGWASAGEIALPLPRRHFFSHTNTVAGHHNNTNSHTPMVVGRSLALPSLRCRTSHINTMPVATLPQDTCRCRHAASFASQHA